MRTRWSPEALADLAGIVRYIREDKPPAAERVRRTIRKGISTLRDFPRMGQAWTQGEYAGTGLRTIAVCRHLPSEPELRRNHPCASRRATLTVEFFVRRRISNTAVIPSPTF